jgi:hypothetical protein
MSDTVEIVLIFGPDGSMQAGIPGGIDPERAGPALKRFFEYLKVDGLPVVQLSEPEKHVHGPGAFRARVSDRA